MKNKYYHYLDVMLGHPFTIYLPLQVQPIVNGENGEPRDIEAKDVENLNVRIKGVGETGIGKQAPFETLYNYVIVHVPASFDEGDVVVRVCGNYGQVCLDASVCAHVKRAGGGLGGILRPYVSPVVGDCGTIADIAPLPLCFTNRSGAMVGLGLNLRDDNGEGWRPNLEISLNGVDWVDFDENYGFKDPEEQDYPIHLAVGMSVYFRGMNSDGFNHSNDDYSDNKFVNFVWSNSEADVSVSGDLASLINHEKRVPLPAYEANFTCLFSRWDDEVEEHTSLTDASELLILSVNSHKCLNYAFFQCNSLVNAPALPATMLAEDCYMYMFNNCHSLVNAPALPATTLAEYCYLGMFRNCRSLVNAPALPATTLATNCYEAMFQFCRSLVNAPALPAKILVSHCYEKMFYGCSSLRFIEMLAATLSPTNAVTNWVQGVPTGHAGTFVKNASATWTTSGNSGVPTNWGITYKQV